MNEKRKKKSNETIKTNKNKTTNIMNYILYIYILCIYILFIYIIYILSIYIFFFITLCLYVYSFYICLFLLYMFIPFKKYLEGDYGDRTHDLLFTRETLCH
ncbi:hypothetical protein EDI_232070 [Entamoeba dispar SAW760]|uniref:Uncharacterized protein n=1 Tax=Entamoeba dispar (strain ATCC PRA-260 / SAW760) TaxID=370354 RepID=B0ECI2_ENTDS|nr:uncharacterized protein EDI_232070 [Entamoeba dispar SAW760]EDR27765.1 hypothetical protein EDI_232070 [Entamoeba dispar SAW760]|eukprot:EDR27765.1 hypothetical protein EDI_232070 [Entamoeba dispar SAW760]